MRKHQARVRELLKHELFGAAMRFEPEHDPDPIRKKFQAISTLEELPEEYKQMHAELFEHANGIAESVQQESGCTEAKSVMSFVAFQGIQIASLQEEIKVLYKALEAVASEVDKKKDK